MGRQPARGAAARVRRRGEAASVYAKEDTHLVLPGSLVPTIFAARPPGRMPETPSRAAALSRDTPHPETGGAPRGFTHKCAPGGG